MKVSTRTLAVGGMFTALVTIATMVIRIPIPIGGYIHIGDSVVYLSGLLLGPVLGAVVSGVGSGIADLFGYAEYVPATVMIKGLDAFLTATIFLTLQKRLHGLLGTIIAYCMGVAIGGSVMVGGYFAYEVVLKGFAYAIGSVNFNVVQAIGGAIVAFPVMVALEKTKFFNRLNPFRK